MDLNGELMAERYNSLPAVFEADIQLAQRDRISALTNLGNIIKRYGLEKALGLRLLHKHNAINCKEVMVEEIDFDGRGSFRLVTAPRLIADEGTPWVANSWMWAGDQFIPMEFSDQRLLADINISPSTQAECFREIADTLLSEKLERVLGPAINVSDAVEENRPSLEEMILSEMTDDLGRRNITTFVPVREVDPHETIQTAWSVEHDLADTTKSCRRVCIANADGSHKGVFNHQPEVN